MIWFAVIAALVLLLILVALQDRLRKPANPEVAGHAAVELHRIRRQLDVAQLKTEQRSDNSRLRREIGDVLDGRREP
jgi:hypothetical protein